MTTDRDLRRWLEAELHPDGLHEGTWQDVQRRKLVGGTLAGRVRREDLLAEVKTLEALHHPDRGRRAERKVGPDRRMEALARIMATAHGRREVVAAFRQDCLGGRWLEPEEVPTWLRDRQREDGEPSWWVTVSAPVGPTMPRDLGAGPPGQSPEKRIAALADVVRRGGSQEPIARWSATRVQLALLDEWREDFRPALFVRVDGILGRLKRLACELASAPIDAAGRFGYGFGWPSEESAVDFLLTGRPPRFAMARAGWSVRETGLGEQDDHTVPALASISLEVNWRTSSLEVRNLYKQLRAELWQGRDKPMTEKHLELAVFVEQHCASGMTWPALRARWNGDYPQWRFAIEDDKAAKRFARDCRSAWSRVSGARWVGLGAERQREEPSDG